MRWEGNVFFGKELGLSGIAGINWKQPGVPPVPEIEHGRYGPAWRRE